MLVNLSVARFSPNFAKILKKTIKDIAEVIIPRVFLSLEKIIIILKKITPRLDMNFVNVDKKIFLISRFNFIRLNYFTTLEIVSVNIYFNLHNN